MRKRIILEVDDDGTVYAQNDMYVGTINYVSHFGYAHDQTGYIKDMHKDLKEIKELIRLSNFYHGNIPEQKL